MIFHGDKLVQVPNICFCTTINSSHTLRNSKEKLSPSQLRPPSLTCLMLHANKCCQLKHRHLGGHFFFWNKVKLTLSWRLIFQKRKKVQSLDNLWIINIEQLLHICPQQIYSTYRTCHHNTLLSPSSSHPLSHPLPKQSWYNKKKKKHLFLLSLHFLKRNYSLTLPASCKCRTGVITKQLSFSTRTCCHLVQDTALTNNSPLYDPLKKWKQ